MIGKLPPWVGIITPRYVHGPVGLVLVEYAICSGIGPAANTI